MRGVFSILGVSALAATMMRPAPPESYGIRNTSPPRHTRCARIKGAQSKQSKRVKKKKEARRARKVSRKNSKK